MNNFRTIASLSSIIFFFAANQSTSAQESNQTDYIINASGDTVRCQIKKTLFSNMVKYKTDKMADYEEVNPYQVKQYFHHKDKVPHRLVTLDSEKKVLYLGLLEEGEINLYEQTIKSQMGAAAPGVGPTVNYGAVSGGLLSTYSLIDWYAEKGLESPVYVKSNRVIINKGRSERKADFISLISDKPAVLDEFKKDNDYSFDTIRDIVHLYNTGERLKKD